MVDVNIKIVAPTPVEKEAAILELLTKIQERPVEDWQDIAVEFSKGGNFLTSAKLNFNKTNYKIY